MLVAAHRPAHLEAVETRQHDVEQQQIGGRFADAREHFGARRYEIGFETGALKIVSEQARDVGIVLRDKDSGHRPSIRRLGQEGQEGQEGRCAIKRIARCHLPLLPSRPPALLPESTVLRRLQSIELERICRHLDKSQLLETLMYPAMMKVARSWNYSRHQGDETMMKAILGSAAGGAVAGAIALAASAQSPRVTEPAWSQPAVQPASAYAMPVANAPALRTALTNAPTLVDCEPGQRAVLQQTLIDGRADRPRRVRDRAARAGRWRTALPSPTSIHAPRPFNPTSSSSPRCSASSRARA